MPNPSDSSSEYNSNSEEEVLSDNIDIKNNDGNHGNEDNAMKMKTITMMMKSIMMMMMEKHLKKN